MYVWYTSTATTCHNIADQTVKSTINYIIMNAIIDVPIFESSDEDEEQIFRIRRPKRFLERVNFFEVLDDLEFFTRFRLQKDTCLHLLEEIRHLIASPTNRNNALSPATKLLLTLRFYATGTMLLAVADFTGVSKAAACIAVRKVTEAIAGLGNVYIKMPTTVHERVETQQQFCEFANFPFVLGAIDCTHVRIQSPGGDNAENYRNRKGYFSWNVQTVCDPQLRIQDIVARWPGSSHDQTIFNNSAIKARFEAGEFGRGILVGDSGYAVKNYMMTPLLNPATPEEVLFNESQIRTRNVVERMYGVWKRRFPILSMGMRVSPETSKAIIVATAVLHNLAIEENDGEPPNEILDNLLDQNYFGIQGDLGAIQNGNNENIRRNQLINVYFRNLL